MDLYTWVRRGETLLMMPNRIPVKVRRCKLDPGFESTPGFKF